MNKKFLLIFTYCFSFTLLFGISEIQAQSSFEKLIDKYSEVKGFNTITIGDEQLQIARQFASGMKEEEKKLLDRLKGQVIAIYEGENPSIEEFL